MDLPEALNMNYMDEQYRQWKKDPDSVSRDWAFFFKGFDLADAGRAPAAGLAADSKQIRVENLKRGYRELGHLLSCLDPLAECPMDHPLLALSAFGLDENDLATRFSTRRFAGDDGQTAPLNDIIIGLRETYCQSIGVEYMHLQDPDERNWLEERMEPSRNRIPLSDTEKEEILDRLTRSAMFEAFLHKKYVGVTRFSLEGGEALISLLDRVLDCAGNYGRKEAVLAMAHRGRLNVQALVLQKPYQEIFSEFESCHDPNSLVGAGDVKYHNGYLADIHTVSGNPMRVFLVNNPSHLESVNPVAQGVARARAEITGEDVLPILIHGDAAFAGQGVVAETLNMSRLDGYGNGGTVHVIINNQIGYTTLPKDARSTRYSTDVAKMLMSPVLHVHGEDPQAVVQAANLACEYRMAFAKDVVIDLVCYRRYGHNEGDEPYFTQPAMYDRIKNRPPVHRLFAKELGEETEQREAAVLEALESAHKEVTDGTCPLPVEHFYENWENYSGEFAFDKVDTTSPQDQLGDLAQTLNNAPEGFNLHPKLKRLMDKRLQSVKAGSGIDWANAEALAFGTILNSGAPIRLSGQDVGRGTFSQRHCVVFDRKTGDPHVPLAHLKTDQGRFSVFNSLLSEAGVLGFEYGYSMVRPEGLTIWEAQFGDFANNAQGVIDLYITSGQAKWKRLSGLVMLLPHGWEGLGPEHSSARLERFLQLCAEDNIQVAEPTTPAQYFHLLLQQALAPYRKPLVVMTPKSLLRHPMAVSDLTRLSTGSFQPVLDNEGELEGKIKRALICGGKIYYALVQRREALKITNLPIIRMERYYPFPRQAVENLARKYPDVNEWVYVQEAPENMGAWRYAAPRLEAALKIRPQNICRPASASPATGYPAIYRRQQADIVDRAVGPEPEGRIAG